jgi:hypothetical protein
VYFVSVRAGLNKLTEAFAKKHEDLRLRNMLLPTAIEKFMGVMCILCTLGNTYYKWQSSTLIFMFNPCHVVCVSSTKNGLTEHWYLYRWR